MVENEVVLQHQVKGTNKTQRELLSVVDPNHPLLAKPNLDNYDHYLLYVFDQLMRDRPIGFNGVMPFQLSSINMYCTLFDDKLLPEEIEILQMLDWYELIKKGEIKEAEDR